MNTVLKAFMGVVVAALFFFGMSYIPDPYGKYIWRGGTLGAVTVLAMFVVGAPVAYMMNTFAYKPMGPRSIMGVLGLIFFPVILGLIFFRPKTYYFGLVPLLEKCGASMGGNSLIDYLYAIWCTIVEPFTFLQDSPDDSTKLMDLISKAAGYGEGVTTMPATILDKAIHVASIKEPDDWETAYKILGASIQQQQTSQ